MLVPPQDPLSPETEALLRDMAAKNGASCSAPPSSGQLTLLVQPPFLMRSSTPSLRRTSRIGSRCVLSLEWRFFRSKLTHSFDSTRVRRGSPQIDCDTVI